jgi:hypothetical protein
MSLIHRLILALALAAGVGPAFAQVPAAVPALPDAERRTSYSISASTCACAVGFQLYGDSTDYANWIEVWVNGVLIPQSGNWAITSPTGSLATIPRPITDAVLTFTAPQTGTVQIVGARRPRRTSQFQEGQPVPTRNFNVVFSDLTAQNRELWDKTNDITGRGLFSRPGETIGLLPTAAQRAGALLTFDGSGNPVATAPGVGTGNVVGPGSSTNSDVACFNGITGTLLKDCGAIGTTTLTGDITGGPSVGTVATTLATVNANVGTWGSTTALPVITVDGNGRITAASNQTITPANIGAAPATRQILGGAGMTAGGALSSDVTLGLATIPSGTILGNNTGGIAAPGDLTPTQVLDILGSTQGQVLYRNATQWVILAPGTNGQLLTSGGAGANVSWSTASGTGTVTSVAAGTGITASPSPIVGAGTISLTAPVTAPLGGTGVVSPATHTIPINQGASAQINTGTGTAGQCLISQGASSDPIFASGCRVLLNTLTASNSATLSDTTSLTGAYPDYEIVFENIVEATASQPLELRVQSGGAFKTTGYQGYAIGTGGAGFAPTTFIPLTLNGAIATPLNGYSGHFRIINPSQSSVAAVYGMSAGFTTAIADTAQFSGAWTTAGVVTGLQFLFGSGNITSGTIKIYGMQ